jgi:Arm DNA-binding domain
MTTERITKRTVDALKSNGSEFTVWDDAVTGFGVRVRPTGAKSYVVVYRAGSGRGAPVRRYHCSGRKNRARAGQSARKGHFGIGGSRARPCRSEGHRAWNAHRG